METRSNHILVGSVTLLLLLALAAFFVWLVRFGDGEKREYDIFFKQSVGGLATGSEVNFAGIPSGQVKDIELWKADPDFVRVRIAIRADTPILQGTTATISSISFTSPPQVQLDGAKKNAPPIEELGPAGVPVIPTKPGALGELLSSAPVLLERLSTLTERLTNVLSDENQGSISGILRNTDKLTGNLAAQGPELAALMQDSRRAVANAALTAEKLSALADNANGFLNANGEPLAKDLSKTLKSAQNSLSQLDSALQEARPGIQRFSTKTLPEVDQLVTDMQALSRSMGSVAERLDEGGAGALVSAPKLPDYKPRGK
jgi:phospholipid/cholesterol/gamma-HCH transport system substrate-binding protein